MRSRGVPVEILLVEDNPGDVRLVVDALEEAGFPHRITIAPDGSDALRVLREQPPAEGEPRRPALILLDLNLPRMDGREVLAEIKRDPSLRRIPVVVFTSSSAARDVRHCYDLQANAYFCKPLDLESMQSVLRVMARFWLDIALLPVD